MFKSQNFCHIASNNRNQVKVGVFVYRTTDNLETVLTSGYFNDRIIDINLHDLIIHEQVSNLDNTDVQKNVLCVTERTLENVGTTLIKSKWEGDIEQAIADLQTYVDSHFVKLDGTSVMTGSLKLVGASDTKGAGIRGNSNGGVELGTLTITGPGTYTGRTLAAVLENKFVPSTTLSMDLGSDSLKWNNAHIGRIITSVINNGYDIAVPVTNNADTLALKSEVDLAANSGRMITDQGVWYAKMYAATVAPAAENGTNYADFSQTDGQGNPVVVLYERQNGAWVQTQTIVPPAEYDGYVPITSKIWDITEQAGQQGGRILWNHQSKDFTPYPQIISFENAALTGTSTAPTPTESSPNNQIANKEYVDNKTSQQGYHPDLFDVKWADHICNDVQWLRADTFSWQSGAVYQVAYQHLADDITGKTLQSETISGTTIQFYLADDGHKICPASEESNVAAIYAATGVAWYYIIDTTNQRFKLPRTKFGFTGIRSGVGKFVNAALPNITTVFDGIHWSLPYNTSSIPLTSNNGVMYNAGDSAGYDHLRMAEGQNWIGKKIGFDASKASSIYTDGATVQPKATEMYLYFYVGNFTQTALENTAGLNAELFNGKADVDLSNVSTTTRSGFLFSVSQESMSAGNYYTLTFPNEIDPTKVKINAYAVIKTANNNFAVGDVIPFESLWGENYRPLSIRIKSTNLQFNTSDQISTNNPNNSGSGVNIVSYIRMVFDVYQVK